MMRHKKLAVLMLGLAASSAVFAGVAGQSLNEQNTATAWEHAAVQVPTDGIQAAISHAIQMYQTGQTASLPVIAETGGTVFFPVGGVIPVLQTQVGHYSLIVFSKGAIPAAVAGAPADQWQVKTLSVAGRPALEIMPLYAGLDNNLQVAATSPHGHLLTYTVGLTSSGHSYTPVLRFYQYRPVPVSAIAATPQQPVNSGQMPDLAGYHKVYGPGPVPAVTPKPVVNATENINPDWKSQCVIGNCAAYMPSSVASAGGQTVIQLPKATSQQPLVLARHKDGQAYRYVPSSMSNHTLYVGAVPHQIDLLSPMGSTEVRIKQEVQ